MTIKAHYSFYVGTYTNAESQGIYRYRLKADGTLQAVGLAVTSESPSFLALSSDKKYLLVVNEVKNKDGVGSVESYQINGDYLNLISRCSSGGAHPCFITTNKDGYVLTANYSSGTIGLHKLTHRGELSGLLDIQKHTGKGTTKRQTEPHAHSAWFNPLQKDVIAIDLGTNELWFSGLDPARHKFQPAQQQQLAMAPGAGPRHLSFHPQARWIYVINELNSTVSQVQISHTGGYQLGASVSTLPPDYNGENLCADIHVSGDGKFVYASNRGHNSIAVFKVEFKNGTLDLIAHETTRGQWPRHFSISPNGEFLVVANEHSNSIVSFKRDQTTGLLGFVDEIEAWNPVCILFG